MLDHLDAAQRHYEQIRPGPARPVTAEKAEQLSLWLETEVCRVVEELLEYPAFRAFARWPIEQLARGAPGKERSLVEAVDAGLVDCAQRLVDFARHPAIQEALAQLGPCTEGLHEAGGNSHDPAVQNPTAPHAAPGFGLIQYIAGRPWRDLVAVEDYFYPTSELNLTKRERYLGPDSRGVQVAEFLPFCNPHLRPLGDYVSRTLLIRVEYWDRVLQRFWVRCRTALQESQHESDPQGAAVTEARGRLQEDYEQLKETCCAGEQAKMRAACIALVQVHADYHPRADRDWLKLPFERARPSGTIRHQVERRHDVSIAEQVAGALVDVAPMYREGLEPTVMIAAKARFHQLVVVMGTGRREVYWQGQLLEVDWFTQDAPWDLFAALVERVKSAQGADAFDAKGGLSGSLKDRRHRLKKLLPPGLDEAIRSAGQGTYKLSLPAKDVCLLRYEDFERLAEVHGDGGSA